MTISVLHQSTNAKLTRTIDRNLYRYYVEVAGESGELNKIIFVSKNADKAHKIYKQHA